MKMRITSPAAVRGVAAFALAALLGIFGCHRSSKQNSSEASAEAQPAAPTESIPDLHRAANGLLSMMRDPKEPFHFSMRRKDDDVPSPFVSEAYFTTDKLEGTSNWHTGAEDRKINDVHTDHVHWNSSIMLLAAPLTSAAIGEMEMAQATVSSAGPDPVGGYDTIKYVFDTSGLPEAAKLRYEALLRVQGMSVTGAAWITKDTQCMVKFVTDYSFTAKNGSIGSVHCEGSLTRH